MTAFTAIDLSRLPAPEIVEPLDYKLVLDALIADFKQRAPDITAVDLESEPIRKLLEVFAYREIILRARINDAAKGVMLAYATGSDLDHLAALFGVQRQVITPADPNAIPPIDAVLETDGRLRQRTQLALEGFSTAGPKGAYRFHALAADPAIADAAVASPSPGEVLVTVLARDGMPDATVLGKVRTRLNAEEVRPLTDQVTVIAATPITFEINASLKVYDGPDATVVLGEAHKQLDRFLAARFRIGEPIGRDGLFGALHVPGVQKVTLTEPEADVAVSNIQFAQATATSVELAS